MLAACPTKFNFRLPPQIRFLKNSRAFCLHSDFHFHFHDGVFPVKTKDVKILCFESHFLLFLQTLVTFSSKMESRRLVTFDPTTLCYKRIPVAGPQHNVNAQGEGGKKKTKEKSTKVASAFPEVDRFIKNLVENNGGYVRKISFQDCWFLIYELANCRYCHNIKRPHKSNNVKFVVGEWPSSQKIFQAN